MLKETILKYALQNAVKYNGKPDLGVVLGKVLVEHPEYKGKIPYVKETINEILKEVVSLNVDEQRKRLETIAPEMLAEKPQTRRQHLTELKNVVNNNVIMRFEPSPSGPLHIGHAYVLGLNSEYCRMYNGKLILRIADTNPKNIYKPSYEMIVDDANWVTKGNISEVVIQSERMRLYYDYMERLLELEKAYICTCEPEYFKSLLLKSTPCPCRELPMSEQKLRWKGMLTDFKQGSAVARLRTELSHKNPAMRDYPLFRILEIPHPKQGTRYRVWPLMNMAVAVDDIELAVTHVIRAKDHYDNSIRQRYIFDYLQKPLPESMFVGRINFIGMDVSCSKTMPLIEDGTYSGWDDIRLPFLQALKRRGYQPEAFIRYALDVGVTLNDKTVSKEDFFKSINSFNKGIIDNISYRYFFIWEPVKINIRNAPVQEIEIDFHPDNKKGGRKFSASEDYYLTSEDYNLLKEGSLCRLMECLNFIKKGNAFEFDSLEYERFKESGKSIIHWIPAEHDAIKTIVIMPDNTKKEGISENSVSKLLVGDIVQFERFGFCRLDIIENGVFIFRYAHR